jgi:MinD-like ATPase involved in chromosome partitioning or flagellar assembly
VPESQDWSSAVLRDLGITPTPADSDSPPPHPATPTPEPTRPAPDPATPAPPDPATDPPPDPAPDRPADQPPDPTADPPPHPSPDAPQAAAGVRPPVPPDLDPERFTRARHHRDPVGRRTVHRVRELLGVGATREVREATARAELLRQPVTTLRRLAVLSVRGGAGKTTVATLLATTLAGGRHDRVLAVDAAPDLGSLALRAGAASPRPTAALGRAASPVRGFEDAEAHLGRADGGPWLLAGAGDDPAGRLDLPAYLAAVATLARFFAVLVTDCGPDPGSDLNQGILLDAHALALVTPATVDGVVSAHQAIGWLRGTSAAALVPRTVVVLSAQTPHTEGVDLKRGARTLASHGVRVARLPYDRHLAAGARIRPDLLGQRTRTAAIGLAADLLTFAVSDRGSW